MGILSLFCLSKPYHHAFSNLVISVRGEDVEHEQPSLSVLDEVCVLWDRNCTGNRTQVLDGFFRGVEVALKRNPCFLAPSPNCSRYGSPARAVEYENIKEWMRSPPCLSTRSEYNSVYRRLPTIADDFCCDQCFLYGDDVDVYYWPSPDADTSCLSLIGTDINPPNLGATTGDGTYWECTTPSTPGTWNFPIRTAEITTIGSLTFKATLRDPWLPPLSCVGTPLTSRSSDSIFARGHSLIVPPSETQQGGMRVTTLVKDGFTLYVYQSLRFLGLELG